MKLAAAVLLAGTLLAAEDVPSWVREAATQTAPAYPAKATVVVLLQEERLMVAPDGARLMRERGALRILQKSRSQPAAYRTYNVKSGRIRAFQGWLLPPGGKPRFFGLNDALDIGLSSQNTYDESRARMLQPGGEMEPGTTFAWEIVEEEKTVFTQYHYSFQDAAPVLRSRFILDLPPGWEYRATLLNRDNLEPQVSGTSATWELRDLPWIEPETHSPGAHALAPRLGVNYFPNAESKPELRPLRDWAAVSNWLAGFADPAVEATPAIGEKARQLTGGASSEFEKIRALAAFAQKVNYVAVSLNTTRGGGYTPHPAGQVLERNYGDCKDKTALLRAMLKAIGIESYDVSVHAGDRRFVRKEWPSSLQFNHAIIAVRVGAGTTGPAVLEHPSLGRLLIFDPTDSWTPLGDLPRGEQGSYALISAASGGELVTLPVLPPESNRVESVSDAQMGLDGSLKAQVTRQYFGQSARWLRGALEGDRSELKRDFEESLSSRLGGLTLERMEPVDRMEAGSGEVKLDFAVGKFGQILQQRLLVVSPGQLVPEAGYPFPAKERKTPVRLAAERQRDRVTLTVAPEFKADEIPDPVKLESAYGSYRAEWKVEKNRIAFEQVLEVKDTLAPASEYGAIRKFFEEVNAGQNSAVVLVK